MSLRDVRSDCADTAGLLQPYVDGELSETEAEQVASHLQACSPCRSAVHEQTWVRTMLQTIQREEAPQALRARIALDLDAVDRETQAETLPNVTARWWDRLRDLARGGLIMVPAGALAVGLFFLARQGLLPGDEPANLAPVVDAGLASAPSSDQSEVWKTLAALEPQVGFELQVADRGAETPRNVQLVSARLETQPEAARLDYQMLDRGHPTGWRVVDIQTPAANAELTGTRQVFRGQTYYLDRTPDGAPLLQFQVEGVAHVLSLEGSGRLPGSAVPGLRGEDADFAVLLAVGDVLRRRANH